MKATDKPASQDILASGHRTGSDGLRHGIPKPWQLLGATTTLYAAFGTIYGLMQGGLPPLLRARGVDLASIGWAFIILVPFGLTFLWAPVIDRVRFIKAAPRIGWIVVMQALIALCLLVVAEGEAFPLPALLAIGLLIAFAAATMDVALDALSSSSVPIDARATAGGLKVAGLAIGSMAGGGVFVALVGKIGWAATFQICAAVSLAAVVPILFARRWDRAVRDNEPAPPSIVALLRQADTRDRLAVLTVCTATLVALSFFNRVMLVDLGVSLEQIGWIVGIGAPICGLLATAIAVPLVRRAGTWAGILLFSALCALSAGAMAFGTLEGEASYAIAGAVTINAGSNGIFVILCATTLGWARGIQPATDYAVLYGLSRLVATVLLIAVSRFVPLLGWPLFYALAGTLMIVVALFARRRLPDFSRSSSAARSCGKEAS